MRESLRPHKDNNLACLSFIVLAALGFGLAAPLIVRIPFPPLYIAVGRVGISFLVILIFVLYTKTNIRLRGKREYLLAIIQGTMMSVHFLTFILSIRLSGVAVAVVVFFASLPIFSLFAEYVVSIKSVAWSIFGSQDPLPFWKGMRPKIIFCVILLFVGLIVNNPLAYSSGEYNRVVITQGVLWGVISSLTYSLRFILVKWFVRVRKYEGRESVILFHEQGFATIILCTAVAIIALFPNSLFAWLVVNSSSTTERIVFPAMFLLLLGFICTSIPNLLSFKGLRRVNASIASAILSLEVVFSGLFNAILPNGSILASRQWAGIILITVATMMYTLKGNQVKDGVKKIISFLNKSK